MVLFERRWILIIFDTRSPVHWGHLLITVYGIAMCILKLLMPGTIARYHLLPPLDWAHPERWLF